MNNMINDFLKAAAAQSEKEGWAITLDGGDVNICVDFSARAENGELFSWEADVEDRRFLEDLISGGVRDGFDVAVKLFCCKEIYDEDADCIGTFEFSREETFQGVNLSDSVKDAATFEEKIDILAGASDDVRFNNATLLMHVITDELENRGFTCDFSHSTISNSCYVTIIGDVSDWTLRISDHKATSSCGPFNMWMARPKSDLPLFLNEISELAAPI